MFAVLVLFAGGGGILVALNWSTSPTTNTAATQPTSAPTTGRSSTPTVSPSAALPSAATTTASARRPITTVAERLIGGGRALLDAMSARSLALSQATKDHDGEGLLDACASFQSDAIAAQNYPPIPDSLGRQHWAKGLPLATGALDCEGAVHQSNNTTLGAQAVAVLNQGTSEVDLVVKRLSALHG